MDRFFLPSSCHLGGVLFFLHAPCLSSFLPACLPFSPVLPPAFTFSYHAHDLYHLYMPFLSLLSFLPAFLPSFLPPAFSLPYLAKTATTFTPTLTCLHTHTCLPHRNSSFTLPSSLYWDILFLYTSCTLPTMPSPLSAFFSNLLSCSPCLLYIFIFPTHTHTFLFACMPALPACFPHHHAYYFWGIWNPSRPLLSLISPLAGSHTFCVTTVNSLLGGETVGLMQWDLACLGRWADLLQ